MTGAPDPVGVPPELVFAAALVATVLALVQTLRLGLRTWLTRRRLRVRCAHALEGEERAEGLLTRLGYAVTGRQVAVTYPVAVDGAVVEIDLRADYLVEQGGRSFVAEVKTGRAAPRVATPATRRQLLEYRLAFDVDGVLLVDVDAERVHAVVFPLPEARGEAGMGTGAPSRVGWLLTGAALGFAAAVAAAAAIRMAP